MSSVYHIFTKQLTLCPPPNVTFCHYFDFQNMYYNFFRFNRICGIFQLLRSGCLCYRDFALFFYLLRRNLWRPLTTVILAQNFLAPAARLPVLLWFWQNFSFRWRKLSGPGTIVILAQLFIAPVVGLSYRCDFGFIFISHIMALYYCVFGSIFLSRLRRGDNFFNRMRIWKRNCVICARHTNTKQ